MLLNQFIARDAELTTEDTQNQIMITNDKLECALVYGMILFEK